MSFDERPPPVPRPKATTAPTPPLHGRTQGTAAPPLPPDDLPDSFPSGTPMRASTAEHVDIAALPDEPELPEALRARQQADLLRRVPAPRDRRPTLLPPGMEQPPKLPSAPRHADPGLVHPVRSGDPQRPPRARETSDVIRMFSPGDAPSPRGAPQPPPPSAGKLVRRGPPPAQISQQQTILPQQAAAPAWRAGQPVVPSVFPLQSDRMVALITEHRARLATLDLMARGLEIGAGLFGTISFAVLIAVLGSVLVGAGGSVLVTAGAIVGAVCGLGITGLMVATAAGLRQLAHTGAQVAALLESLSAPHR